MAEEKNTPFYKGKCNCIGRCHSIMFILLLLLSSLPGTSQSVKELFANSGIWQDYSYPVLSAKTYPEIRGRLVNIKWSELETLPNVWNWSVFDQDIKDHTADNMPVIFMVYTGMNAPQWLYTNGVPKVNISTGNYAPFYLDADYNYYFKRMITQVRQHVQTLTSSLRNLIIGVQACFANTGDQLSYQGDVPQQYAISDNQFDSLFRVYSLYYYNEYSPLVPAIKMLSNPNYYKSDQQEWLDDNCPGGWTKCGTIGKGFQLNTELDKQSWLFDIMNKPVSGQYVRSRCEINGQQLYAAWWTKSPVKNLFALMCYDVYWGLDWSNQITSYIQDSKYDSCLRFFNKYAGQKVAGVASNALCALKDVLDASDEARFPESVYGNADRDNTNRYVNIYNSYISYGARLEDKTVITGNEYDCLKAKGTNDVGWRLIPGNYERYLHQIDANITSAGYWNVNPENPDAMYGRFARGFDLSKGKNALYFDVENAFLRSAPLNGKYAVTIDVIYYDNGTGSWQLYYDAQSTSNKASVNVVCGNTKTWKKKTIQLTDAYFGNRGTRNSDFYIKSTNSTNVIFSTVELSRPSQSATGFITTTLPSFNTVCINGTSPVNSFVLNAAYLNGTTVQVGPFNGYTFSKSSNGTFSTSLTYTGYGTQINSTVYVKMNTSKSGVYNGSISITGGGVTAASVGVTGTVSGCGVKNSSGAFAAGSMFLNEQVYNKAFVIPNPANDIAVLQFYANKSFNYSIQVTDVNGKILLVKKTIARTGTNYEKLNLRQLTPGNYFITLINGEGERQTLRLMKE